MIDRLRRMNRAQVLEFAGVTALTAGIAFFSWPLALIVGGVIGILLAQGIDRTGASP